MPETIKKPGFWESLAANLGRPGQVPGFNLMTPFYGMTREGQAAGQAQIAGQQAERDRAQGFSAVQPSATAAAVSGNELREEQNAMASRLLPQQEQIDATKGAATLADMRELVRLVTDDPSKNPSAVATARIMLDLMDGKLGNEAKQFGLDQQKQAAKDVEGITGTNPIAARELMNWRQGQAGVAGQEAQTASQEQQTRLTGADAVRSQVVGGYATPQGAQAAAIPQETAQRQQQLQLQEQKRKDDLTLGATALMGLGSSPRQEQMLRAGGVQIPQTPVSPEQAAAQRAQAANNRTFAPQRPPAQAAQSQPQPQAPLQPTTGAIDMLKKYDIAPGFGIGSVRLGGGEDAQLQRLQMLEEFLTGTGRAEGKRLAAKGTNDLNSIREMIRQLKTKGGK